MATIIFVALICITTMTALYRICKCIETVLIAKTYERCVYYIYNAKNGAEEDVEIRNHLSMIKERFLNKDGE